MEETLAKAFGSKTPLSIRMLGDFAVCVEGQPLPRPRSRAERWLLALLLLHYGRTVSRDWLQETLWPDSLPEQAQENLRHALTNLRKALGSQAYRLEAPSRTLLCFVVEISEADLLAFDTAVQQKDTASLETAIALYGGPLLPNCTEAWILPERERRQMAFLNALETLAERAAKRGDYAIALDYLRRVLQTDDMRETACRELMRVLAQTGAYAEAFTVYRRLRQNLRTAFAGMREPVAPAPETTALYNLLRREAKQRASPAEPSPQETTHSEAAPNTLPRLLASFIGRERECQEIGDLLESERLVTLVGPGGVGKTRLALEAAKTAQDNFPDGVFLADLSPLTDPELLWPHLAALLSVREVAGEPLQETLRVWLRRRSVLLLLDNCEALADAAADLVVFLLEHAPELHVLATSRQPLRAATERIYPIFPLSLPEATPDLGLSDFQAAEAVQLFETRAKQARPDFAVTLANVLSIGNLCRRLDGLPLAIELAAARVAVFSVLQIAAMLAGPLRTLPNSARAVPVRHQTLQNALDWSYDLLSLPERTLLRHLAIFAGSFSLEAAMIHSSSPLSPTDDSEPMLLERLSRLVEKSLLCVLADEPPRYVLLETLREYGREKLRAAGEEAATRQQMFVFYTTLVSGEAEGLRAAEAGSMARIEKEQDNLRAALEWGLGDPLWHGEALQMASALRPFWQTRGQWSEGRRWLRSAQETHPAENQKTRPIIPPAVLASAQHSAGTLALEQGDYGEAVKWLHQALERWQETGDDAGAADTLTNLGAAAFYRNEGDQAREYLLACLSLRRKQNDRSGEAHALVWLGNLAMQKNDYAEAQSFFEQALAFYDAQKNPLFIAQIQNNLAVIAYEQENFVLAKALYTHALERFRAARYGGRIALTLNNLGNVLREIGDYREAKTLLEEAIRHWQEMGDDAHLPPGRNTLGLILCALEEYKAAREHFLGSARAYLKREDAAGLVCSFYGLAWVAVGSQQSELAARMLGAADHLRDVSSLMVSAADLRDQKHVLSIVHDGQNGEVFAAAYQAGSVLSPQHALLEVEMLLTEASDWS